MHPQRPGLEEVGRGLETLREALTEGTGGEGHVYFSVGKGGVGKTTVSILASLALAPLGRTLLASLDPAKHLLEYLGLRRVAKPERTPAGFDAVQYDVDSVARRVAEEYAILLRQVMPGLTVVNLAGVVRAVRHAPGFEEEVFLRILRDLTARLGSGLDYLVVDTPPTGVTHRILNLPRLYLLWLAHLHELRLKIVSLRYTIAKIMRQDFRPDDPVLRKLERLQAEYKALADLLRDPSRASLILVATPEPLPVYETKTSLEVARDLGMRVRLIVVNRVLPRSMAEKLGTRQTQLEALREVESLDCGRCRKLAILHSSQPPRSLEGAKSLAALILPLEEALEKT